MDRDDYGPAHHVYCITESTVYVAKWPIALRVRVFLGPSVFVFAVSLQSLHCVPQMVGPGMSGGIPELKSNLTVKSLYVQAQLQVHLILD